MLKKIACALFIFNTFVFQAKADDGALIATVYTTIIDKHLTPVEVEDIAIAGLKSLSETDRAFTFANGSNMVYLYYKGQQVGLWHKPEDLKDAKAWGKLSGDIIKKAAKISPKAQNNEGRMAEIALRAAANELKDHSQYHFSDELEEDLDSSQFLAHSDGKILYIRIKNFSAQTATLVKNAITARPQTAALIIDLRGNSGGRFNSAIEVAKLFIDDGIIVTVKGRPNEPEKYYVSENKNAFNFPMVVLIDEKTASSAEVLSAALQEQAQAQLVGSLSYGKGTIQEMYVFDNGGRLALTSGQFYTPSGSKIDKIGLFPNYCIINDKLVNTPPCPQQKRAGRPFDVDYAKRLLAEQI